MSKNKKDTSDSIQNGKQTSVFRGNNYLFLIGIDEYQKKLNNCISDAEAIKKMLWERYFFKEEYTVPLWNENATREKIYDQFELYKKTLTEDDNLIIYYSGHGTADDTHGFSWITIKSEKGSKAFRITQNDIISYLGSLKARHIFLIVDSCFSGTIFRSTGSEIDDPTEQHSSRWCLSSGRGLVDDGKPGEHSPFATALLDILSKNSEPLGVARLGELVTKRVSEATNQAQNPVLDSLRVKTHDGGQFIFHPIHTTAEAKAGAKGSIKEEEVIDILAHIPIKDSITYPEIPFKGLSYFSEEDARIFFGRSQEIRDIYNLLESNIDQRSRVLLFYGQSGIGKSSLLFAGLLPRFPKTWLVRYKRRSEDGDAISIIKQFMQEMGQSKWVKAILIIDQLEEMVYHQSPEQEELSRHIRTALEQFPQLSIILSFREEYLSAISTILGWPPESYTNVPLGYLNKPGILEAIRGITSIPVNHHYRNITFEDPDLPLSIAKDFIQLDKKSNAPLLQYLLRRIWDVLIKETPQNEPLVITTTLYDQLRKDSLQELLETQLGEVGESFPLESENGLLIDLLYFFVGSEVVSSSHPIAEILATYHHIDPNRIQLICKKLEDCYLLSAYKNSAGKLCYRLSHDALAQPVMLRYLNSRAPGQLANKDLADALQRGNSLSKEELLIIEQGEFGRRAPSPEEKLLIQEGWEKHLPAIARDELNRLDLEKSLNQLIVRFNKLGKNSDNLILFSVELYSIADEDKKGLISFSQKLDIKQQIIGRIFEFINSIDLNFKSLLISNLESVISGDFYLAGSPLFQELLQASSISSRLNELKLLSEDIFSSRRKSIIDDEDYVLQNSKLIDTFFQVILTLYCDEFSSSPYTVVLSKVEIINVLISVLTAKEVSINDISTTNLIQLIQSSTFLFTSIDNFKNLLVAVAIKNWLANEFKKYTFDEANEQVYSAMINHALYQSLQQPNPHTPSLGTEVQVVNGHYFLQLLHENRLDTLAGYFYLNNELAQKSNIHFVIQSIIELNFKLCLFLIPLDRFILKQAQGYSSIIKELDHQYNFSYDTKYHSNDVAEELIAILNSGQKIEFSLISRILNEKSLPFEVLEGIIIISGTRSILESLKNYNLITENDFSFYYTNYLNHLIAVINNNNLSEYFFEEETQPIIITSKEEIIGKISKGDLETAFKLTSYFVSSQGVNTDDLAILKSRYYNLDFRYRKKQIRDKDYWVEFNRIINSLVELLNTIDDDYNN